MKYLLYVIIILLGSSVLFAQDNYPTGKVESDSLKKARKLLQEAKVEAAKKEIALTIRSVDISNFPIINIIIEAYNKLGEPLDSLTADNLFVYESGKPKKILKVDKIPVARNVPVDFIFVIDKTGSMQNSINSVISNISSFASSLMRRGIDYRIGLVLFSDDVEKIFQPTNKVTNFLNWLMNVQAAGGKDKKENALKALDNATDYIEYRDEADKVFVLVTDAPYHQKGESGDGFTKHTTESIVEKLVDNNIRVFSIVPKLLVDYETISKETRGTFYDIDYPFATILDNFSNQLTNLFKLSYRSDEEAIPDSIEIALFNKGTKSLVKKTIPIVELGRKLIIENLLYKTNSASLPDSVKELDILAEFLIQKPNIAIVVEGHTDAIGSHALNDALSVRRAESVKTYLIKKGVSELRVQTKGYGERKPIASNATEFGRKLNRRTEIIIVAK